MQKLDHFDHTNTAVWSQRYFVNDTFHKKGGPIFLMLGGEGPASPVWNVAGAWQIYAKKLNAITIQIEHRYYGQSHPVSDASTPNLKYLSSEQALADAAYFREYFMTSKNMSADTKWIVFGGSYSGALSAWLRTKYPHLFHASVATSAPILAKVDFEQYLQVVTKSLQTAGMACTKNIHNATTIIQGMIKTSAGRKKLSQMFKTCKPLSKDPNDISTFMQSLAGNFEGIVQYNKDNTGFERHTPATTLTDLCKIMEKNKPLDGYVKVNSLILKQNGQKCNDVVYKDMIKQMQQSKFQPGIAGRLWFYQTCTEFGYYQTSDSKKQSFGNMFPIKYWVQQCADVFGKKFSPSYINGEITMTNNYYGALAIKGTRIVFPNGSIDPWHALGLLKSTDATRPTIFIKGTAHCANMYPPTSKDPAGLRQARTKILGYLTKWLKEKS
ncbi:uncharacterized protein TRIADDRAFT_63413 [Trichoplax adhaerens]|uniref:Serine protease K12H4.7 n=1 Tax=Trichoplax adhaerens TaxID=10228 RepID=B3S9X4_TRIAD|nr:hypothetical protein TRIADDRAFT_63413 [Trichoplax adhaerens]EDV20342.1 hypothetical protein TRIADDRAFT_63413 [Trichoplax adhaerens]|eukprot:XP_002117036.1 hypothetical protein TRIADDRAFT_63413 [Trichoplax adhaerens]